MSMRSLVASLLLVAAAPAWGQGISANGGGGLAGNAGGGSTVTPTGGSSAVTLSNLAAQVSALVGGGFALAPGTIAISSGGSGYSQFDVITLTCAGCTISTAPTAVVAIATGGAITSIQLANPGLLTAAPAVNPVTFTQASTTGAGTGAKFTVTLGPVAAAVSYPSLGTGGGATNGNMYIGALTDTVPYAGNESVFVGSLAGTCLVGGAQNVAIGHNAFGAGNGLPCANTSFANNDVVIGTDTFRNTATASGTINSATVVGSKAGLNSAGTFANVTMLGAQVGSTTFVNGSNDILIGTSSSVDTPASNTSNYINIGNIMTTTGTGTPLSSVTNFAGQLQGTAPAAGQKAIFACQNAACTGFIELTPGYASSTQGEFSYWTGSAFGPLTTASPFLFTSYVTVQTTLQLVAPYTVATLPTCNSGASGTIASVSDATSPTYNATLTGSGAVHTLAYCNGSNWTAH